MTLKRTYSYKLIALLVAFAFMYVQGTALNCGIHHLIDQSGIPHSHPVGHDHHHNKHDESTSHHHDSGAHDKSEKKCCGDFTQAFFRGVIVQPGSTAGSSDGALNGRRVLNKSL